MRAAAKTIVLFLFFSCLSYGQAGATAIATDITSVIDISSLSFSVNGIREELLTPNSMVSVSGGTSIPSSSFNYGGSMTASGATTNAAAESIIIASDSLTTRISALSDFTTTQIAYASAVAQSTFYLNTYPYSGEKVFNVLVNYSFAGSASTELPGDYLGLQGSGVSLTLKLQIPNSDGWGSHTVTLASDQESLFGTNSWLTYPESGIYTNSGTLSLSGSYVFEEAATWSLLVELESRGYAQTGATQPGSSSTAVPEPSTLLLLGSGLLGLVGLNRRRNA